MPLPLADWVGKTVRDLDIYVNGTTGADTNTGLTLASPKKTLEAGYALIPYHIDHTVNLHVAGIISWGAWTDVYLEVNVSKNGLLFIDGGPSYTTVADNGGSPWVADIHSTTTLGKAAVGWVANAYAGWWVEVVTGACAGETRMIQSNTTDTITPSTNWTVDPGLAQFRIVRPATEIQTNNWEGLYFRNRGVGGMNIQSIYFSGRGYLQFDVCPGTCQLLADIFNIDYDGCIYATDVNTFYAGGYRRNTTTGAWDSTHTTGVSCVHASGGAWVGRCAFVLFSNFYSPLAHFAQVQHLAIIAGSKIKSATIYDCASNRASSYPGIYNSTGCATTKLGGGAGVGLSLKCSNIHIGSGVDVSGAGSHGIEIEASFVKLLGALTGTANTGAGVYAHDGTTLHTKSGTAPTITGTVGNLAISDPAVAEETWANIEAGRVVSMALRSTLVRKV